MAGKFHPVGDLAGDRLDPVAPFGDEFSKMAGMAVRWALIGRDEDGGAAGGQLRFDGPAAEVLVREQVARGWRGSSRSIATSRSLTAAGTMAQARTIRLPRWVLIARRKP